MATRMQQRRGTAQQWTDADPILAAGEIGFETDTNQFKIGDGVNAWSDLSYFKNLEDLGGSLDDYVPVSTKGQANGVAELDSTGNVPMSQLGNIIDGAPAALDTLNEISTLLGDGSSLGASVVSSLNALDTALANHADNTSTAHGMVIADLATHTYVGTAVSTHDSQTINVHGIADTSALATKTYADDAVTVHNQDLTNVHGIADTTELATKTYANDAVSTHNADTTNVHGIADTSALALSVDVTSEIAAHSADTTDVHGITDTANLVYTSDSRLSDERTPSAGSVTAAKIAADAVETAKIADNAVTNAKLADNAVDTAEIKDLAVTNAKLAGSIAQSKVTNLETDIASKQDKVTGVSDTEIGYLDGVTSAIQTQIDGKASLSGATFTGAVSGTSLTLSGNLTVSGTTTTVSAQDLVVSDPLIYIGEGNTANLVDLGIVSSFNDGTYQHAGIVRDSSAGKWKIFKGVTDEPTTTVNFTQGSLDALAVGALEATTVTPSSGIVFSDGTQTKVGVPSITTFATAISSSATLATGEQDKFVPLTGAVTITLPATGYSTGQSIDFYQASGTGAQFASTNSVVGTPGLKFRTTNSVVTAMKTPTGWLVFGDLSA